MKRRLAFLFLLLLGLPGPVASVWAGSWREMPPDERRQLREQMREHWQQERAARQLDVNRHWREMPPGDRERLRQEMREQRGSWKRPPGGRDGGRD